MFNIKIDGLHLVKKYVQVPQPNPLQWQIMHRKKDTLYSQAGEMQCRDFFNDVVAHKKTEKVFHVYGFTNEVKFNRFGIYLLLTKIHNPSRFISNVNNTLNVRLKEQLGVSVELYEQDENSVVVHVPNKVWTKTAYISLATYVLRLCNYEAVYSCWNDLFTASAPINSIENAFDSKTKKIAKDFSFALPSKYKKYWYFAGEVFNSNTSDWDGHVLHNNGYNNWCYYMKGV